MFPVRWAWTAALYLALACLITFPLVTDLSGAVFGFEYGDGYENVHHVWWIGRALSTGRSPFTAADLGYPDGIDGVTLWAHPLQTFPAWALAPLTGAVAAVNLAALLSLTLNGLALCALVHHLTRAPGAAVIAGAAYLLFPTFQGHLGAGHSGMIVGWTLPLYALALLRLRAAPSARRVAIAVVFGVASAWGHSLQALYATAPVTLALIGAAWLAGDRRGARAMLIGAAGAAAGLALFLIPSARAALSESAYIDAGGVVRYSADLLAPITPSFLHPVYGRLLDYPARVLGVNLDEGAAYIGLVGGLLLIIGIVRVPAARVWALLAAGVFILALGPVLKVFDTPVTFSSDGLVSAVTLPFAAIADLPGVSLARTPARFNLALALAVCVGIGYGAAVIRARGAGALALITLIAFDTLTFAPFPTAPALQPPGVLALRDQAEVRAVFDVPYDNLITAKRALYFHTLHTRPLIAGQVTRQTPVEPAKLTLLAALDPAHLRAAGADAVIVHRREDADGALLARARAQLGEPLAIDADVAVFLTPDADPPPFTVAWAGAPLTLETRAALPVYSPAETGALLTLDARSPHGARDLVITSAGREIGRWTIDGSARVEVFFGLAAGYQTVTLAVDPPCIFPLGGGLACRALHIDALTLAP
jgi:hypothetical protein